MATTKRKPSRYAGTRALNSSTPMSSAVRSLAPRMYASADPRWRRQAEAILLTLTDVLGDPLVGDLDRVSVDEVLDFLEAEGKGPATRDRWLATFGKFCRELRERKALDEVPKMPTQDRRAGKAKRIATLSPAEVEEIQSLAENECGAPGVARAVRVLADTGLRVGELMRVKPEHVSVDRSGQAWLWVLRTKNGTDREIPLTDAAREILQGGDLPSRRHLQRVWGDVRRLMGRSQDADFVLHILRHTALTRMASTMPIHDVQAVAGHSDIKTTMKYVHSTKGSLRRSFKQHLNSLQE